MRLGTMLGWLAAVSLAGAACSSPNSGNPTGAGGGASVATGAGGGATVSTCDGLAKVVCDKLDACAPTVIALAYGSVAHCSERLALGLCASSAGVDFAACGADYATLSCDAIFASDSAPAGCVSTSAAADGAPCGEDAECKSSHCVKGTDSACGTCEAKVAAGGACGMVAQVCASGFTCLADTCTKLKPPGDACAATDECSGAHVCIGGKCGAPPTEGEACTQDIRCSLFEALYCSPKTNTCKAVGLANVGESCGYDMAGDKVTLCKVSDCAADDKCVAPLKDGDACMTGPNQPSCEAPAECLQGKCTPPMADTCK